LEAVGQSICACVIMGWIIPRDLKLGTPLFHGGIDQPSEPTKYFEWTREF
jgi:hypothetical protein